MGPPFSIAVSVLVTTTAPFRSDIPTRPSFYLTIVGQIDEALAYTPTVATVSRPAVPRASRTMGVVIPVKATPCVYSKVLVRPEIVTAVGDAKRPTGDAIQEKASNTRRASGDRA